LPEQGRQPNRYVRLHGRRPKLARSSLWRLSDRHRWRAWGKSGLNQGQTTFGAGGLGAQVTGTFDLLVGESLRIDVGGGGGDAITNAGTLEGGGGGGGGAPSSLRPCSPRPSCKWLVAAAGAAANPRMDAQGSVERQGAPAGAASLAATPALKDAEAGARFKPLAAAVILAQAEGELPVLERGARLIPL
jgi:hypothetical protein